MGWLTKWCLAFRELFESKRGEAHCESVLQKAYRTREGAQELVRPPVFNSLWCPPSLPQSDDQARHERDVGIDWHKIADLRSAEIVRLMTMPVIHAELLERAAAALEAAEGAFTHNHCIDWDQFLPLAAELRMKLQEINS